jgi:hypothetical protein
MIHTQEQLDLMTDHEVGLAVAKKSGINYREKSRVCPKGIKKSWLEIFIESERYWEIFNPCEDWNDVMPIAEKYHLSVSFDADGPFVYTVDNIALLNKDHKQANNPNPRRAICEVFLMMEV